jgi:hypothetical protein
MEEQGDIASTLQCQVKASFRDVQEYKEASEVAVLKALLCQRPATFPEAREAGILKTMT